MLHAKEVLLKGYKKVLPHVRRLTGVSNNFWRIKVFMTDYTIVDRAHLKEYYDVLYLVTHSRSMQRSGTPSR
jgi:hypothetical protein